MTATFIPRQLTQIKDSAGTALPDVSSVEVGYLDGVTSAIQSQIDATKLNGPNLIICPLGSSGTENAANLSAAYTAAKALSPAWNNRITILLKPGVYDFDTNGFTLDADCIDIQGLVDDASLTEITSKADASHSRVDSGTLVQTAQDVHIKNLTLTFDGTDSTRTRTSDEHSPAAYFPSSFVLKSNDTNDILYCLAGLALEDRSLLDDKCTAYITIGDNQDGAWSIQVYGDSACTDVWLATNEIVSDGVYPMQAGDYLALGYFKIMNFSSIAETVTPISFRLGGRTELSNVILKNIKSTSSGKGGFYTRYKVEYSGVYDRILATGDDDSSYIFQCGSSLRLSGKWSNCIIRRQRIFRGGVLSGLWENIKTEENSFWGDCHGVFKKVECFGANCFMTVSLSAQYGWFEDCTVWDGPSFNGGETFFEGLSAAGVYIRCVARNYAFGAGSSPGYFEDCSALPGGFASAAGTMNGRYLRCKLQNPNNKIFGEGTNTPAYDCQYNAEDDTGVLTGEMIDCDWRKPGSSEYGNPPYYVGGHRDQTGILVGDGAKIINSIISGAGNGYSISAASSDTHASIDGCFGNGGIGPNVVNDIPNARNVWLAGPTEETTGNLTVLDTTDLGGELVTNGTFTGGTTGWTLGTGWAYDGGSYPNVVLKNADGTGTLSPTTALSPIPGKRYWVTYDVSEMTAGDLTVSFAGVTLPKVTLSGEWDHNRVYSYPVLATSTDNLVFTPTNTSRFFLDNVSIKEILGGEITAAGQVIGNLITPRSWLRTLVPMATDFMGEIYTDDVTPSAHATFPPYVGSAILNGIFAPQAGVANHSGIIRISNFSGGGGYQFMVGKHDVYNCHLISGGEVGELVFKTYSALANRVIASGFFDDGPYYGLYMSVSGSSLTGKATNEFSTTTTGASYTLSTSTWYRIMFVVNDAADRVDFYVFNESGIMLWTDYVTSNIPTGPMGYGVKAIYNSAETGQEICWLDAISLHNTKALR